MPVKCEEWQLFRSYNSLNASLGCEDTENRVYLDSGPWKLPPPCSSEIKPQYVHHLTLSPPPEISHSIPKRKGVKQRCVKFTVAAVICLLILLLLAGILLGYYYSSPCARGRQCGDGGCVWESQWCDGVMDCPAGQDEANCVRVHGSNFLLQIYSTQSKNWRTVCSQGWSDLQGRASCHQIGYSRDTYFKSGHQQTDSDDGFLIVKSDFNPDLAKPVVLSADCGSGENSSRASGGKQAPLGAWPWQVSLQVGGSHRCGGAVISPYWIVTAAHCVVRASSPADWAVYAGIVDPLGTLFNPAYPVSRIIAHKGYNSVTRRSDIALMRLSKPLDQTDSGASYLMEAQVSLIDPADCNSSMAYNGRISQDMLCAREVDATGNMCHTDSGGPLVSLKDGVWWLIGDSIWGEDCTEHNRPGVYGNIAYFLDWIFHQMRL
uniref:transmembrane protease serine 2-like n=1 Tax=Semicossyphus pulcher TaxID=241346 RepID=UPI0037E848F5